MAQSGLLPASRTTDYFLFTTQWRLPSDPLHAIAQVLASDMGRQVQNWLSGPSTETRMQELDRKAQDTLLPPRDPVPSPRLAREIEENEIKPEAGGAF
jgi:hypothetical protein